MRINVVYKIKNKGLRAKHTFFSSHAELGVWLVQHYKDIEIEDINYKER